jgi:hypothetical protein
LCPERGRREEVSRVKFSASLTLVEEIVSERGAPDDLTRGVSTQCIERQVTVDPQEVFEISATDLVPLSHRVDKLWNDTQRLLEPHSVGEIDLREGEEVKSGREKTKSLLIEEIRLREVFLLT